MMVSDFEEHAGSMLAWPFRSDIWRENGVHAQRTLQSLARAISDFEPVMVAATREHYSYAKSIFAGFAKVIELSYDDIWLRDTAPVFVRQHDNLEARCFRFNAWGGIYYPCDLDDQLASKVCDLFSVPYAEVDYVLEGGAVVSNGQGTIITTEECILNPNRNGNLSRQEHEAKLRDSLLAERVIWLPSGLEFDETSGHVDEICCFCDHDHVLLAWTDDALDPNYERVRAALQSLADGKIGKITKVPLPKPIKMTEHDAAGYYQAYRSMPRLAGELYAASYLNFIFVNGGAIVPRFGDPRDDEALEALRAAMPNRKIVALDSRELVLGGGSFHCIVKDLPSRVLGRSPLLSS